VRKWHIWQLSLCRDWGGALLPLPHGLAVELAQRIRRNPARRFAALLLDAQVPGQFGGTGTAFDWSLVPRSLSLPVVLSGGLDAGNVGGAIRAVKPWAVDVSSGVESARGVKDAARIEEFVRSVRDADASAGG